MTTKTTATDEDVVDDDDATEDVEDGHEDVEDLDDVENDSEDDDDGDDEPQSVLTDDDLERIARVAAEAANSVADKRINQVLAKQKRQTEKPDADGTGSSDRGSARYIKTVIRDEVRDLGLSDVEEKLIRKFAVQMVDTADLTDVDDEDSYAADIVEQAAEMVGSVQSELSQSLRDSKKRRGGNGTGTKKQPGKKPKGTVTDDVKAQMEAGRKRAEERYAKGTRT